MQKKVITYCRVSSDEQAQGYSLRNQKAILQAYCSVKNYAILHEFEENYSAKNFEDRPEFNRLLRYVKTNKREIDILLINRWDRFSRNLEAALKIIRLFKQMGIDVNASEQPLDLSQSDSLLMLAVYLVIPEVENLKNSQRTTSGMRRGSLEGAWMGASPVGYLYHRTPDGKATLKPNEKIAPIIRKVFKEYATGIYSSEEIRKKYYSQGLKVSKNSLLNILKNPAYCGKVVVKEFQKEPQMIISGLHEAIIDEKTFAKVQNIFLGKRVKPVLEHKEIDEILPLRGFLRCPSCSRALTGSGSLGGKKIRHFYYHCNPPCKIRFKSPDVHNVLYSLLKEFVINDDAKEVYKKVLDKTFKTEAGDREAELKSIKREINKLQTRLDSIEEKFFDDQIDGKTYNASKRKTEVQMANLKAELESISAMEKDFDSHLKKGISFLQKVDVLYKNAPAPIKKKILASLFPEKLLFETTHFKTSQIDDFIGYIILKNKKLKYLKVDKPIAINFNFKQARAISDFEISEQ